MIFSIFLLIIEVCLLLWILKTGWLLSFLQNVPFIDWVAGVVSNYFGFPAVVTPAGTTNMFLLEILNTFLFLGCFSVLEQILSSAFRVGKHEKYNNIKSVFYAPVKIIAVYYFSALGATVGVNILKNLLQRVFPNGTFLNIFVVLVIIAAVIVISFLVMGIPIIFYCGWVIGKIIFPTVVKLVCMEYIVVFLYYLLNLPGMLEQTGTIVIMLIGIGCCIGRIFGADAVGKKTENWIWSRGRHAK